MAYETLAEGTTWENLLSKQDTLDTLVPHGAIGRLDLFGATLPNEFLQGVVDMGKNVGVEWVDVGTGDNSTYFSWKQNSPGIVAIIGLIITALPVIVSSAWQLFILFHGWKLSQMVEQQGPTIQLAFYAALGIGGFVMLGGLK